MIDWQEKLSQIFNSKVKLNEEEVSALLNKWNRPVQLKRNDFLITKGQTESSLFFVLNGSMRIYFPNNEDEICVGFCHPHNLVCSYPSFILNKPSEYYIQALAKTELIAIDRSDFYLLFDAYRSIERAWRMLEEEALIGKIEREVEMLTFTPEERYNRLIKRSPYIFQTIPRKFIASYLRMTPETLSRIRPA
jgi:CRP-like cAMP-binding protein